eukprot:Rhum_TRINITY_DN25447_c0_g1::Rhum_TRINITY_DN25447_c0_g1_i1::g.182150::m.182150
MNMRSESAVYKLELPCRALTSAVDPEQHLFLLGTLSLKGKNQIYLLEYKEDTSLCECLATWLHPYEIWHIASCPSTSQKDLFFTTHGTGEASLQRTATLWTKEKGTATGLGKLLTLDVDVRRMLWEPQGIDTDKVLGVGPRHLHCVSVEQGGKVSASIDIEGEDEVEVGSWDPHHTSICAVGAGGAIHRVDTREREAECLVPSAHPTVTTLEYNPNKQYHVLTGGDDGCLKFWDVRFARQSLRVVRGHNHWVTCATHNPSHEQLVLSASTDRLNTVKLWSLPTLASHTPPSLPTDSLLKSVADYDDTAYAVAWSSLSPWLFASVSYASKVMVHRVPRETKYSILLSE